MDSIVRYRSLAAFTSVIWPIRFASRTGFSARGAELDSVIEVVFFVVRDRGIHLEFPFLGNVCYWPREGHVSQYTGSSLIS